MSAAPPPLTLHRRFGAGAVLRTGTLAPYRRVQTLDGEAHAVRHELAGGSVAGQWSAHGPSGGRALLSVAHLTDLQLADVQSPTRFEFFNREYADPRFAKLVPVQRPQEALTSHAVTAMVDTLNRVTGGPVSGAPLQLAVTTGDAIDNAQWNELQAFLALLDGGNVRLASGSGKYEGVQAADWPDDVFWRPDGDGPGPLGADGLPGRDGPDLFRTAYGFGLHPGLLERALADFRAGGLRMPWLACYGNHEALIQGVGVVTPAVAAAMVGDRKPARLPGGLDLDQALELFTVSGDVFLGGLDRVITADPSRHPITRRQFVEAHFAAGARPHGHGFTERNRRDGTAYYSHDTPAARLIALDTTCLAGAADGSLDADQLRWLEEQLVEVHSSYRAPDGTVVRTGHEDRLVVLFSHHGLDTLTNTRAFAADGAPVVTADDVLRLLHRFGNVVVWLSGHTHTNGVRPRVDPLDSTRGFWEVTTCAVVDWPCQTRLVELVDGGDGVLWITCTMVDHDSPAAPAPVPASQLSGADLAGLHRELAGNVPWAGFDSPLSGSPSDRNVVLPLRAPFPLRTLPAL
ncbi:MAG TPA: TIGR03767 family metallophosphoesterase [Kineosporiaceae bacterium]|nr:TIGR03767 family metallophosphoesterase [Kineosporiaceae bacterium]